MERIKFNNKFHKVEKSGDDYAKLIKRIMELTKLSYWQVRSKVESLEPGLLASIYEDSLSKWSKEGFKNPAQMFWTKIKKTK